MVWPVFSLMLHTAVRNEHAGGTFLETFAIESCKEREREREKVRVCGCGCVVKYLRERKLTNIAGALAEFTIYQVTASFHIYTQKMR